jgi:uncharacterized protein Usg
MSLGVQDFPDFPDFPEFSEFLEFRSQKIKEANVNRPLFSFL